MHDERGILGGRRLLAVVCVVVAVAAGLGWLTWRWLSDRAADEVSASWILECSGTSIGTHEGQPAIRSKRGWTCDVVLTITNDGDRSVEVGTVKGPYLGTHGGAEVKGLSTEDAPFRDTGDEFERRFGSVDGEWDVDLEVPGSSSRTIRLPIRLPIGWREAGCSGGGWFGVPDWPTIVFDVLGRTHEYRPQQDLTLRTYDDPHDERACSD